MNQDEYMEINLAELFFELMSSWKLMVISAILMAVIFLTYSGLLVTPRYQSTSELYVFNKTTSSTTTYSDVQVSSSLSDDYMVVVTTRSVLEQVISDLNLDLSYKELKSNITVTSLSDRILQISVLDPDPGQAKAIADDLAEVSSVYIAQTMNQEAPNIIEYGYADGKAVAPNLKKNTLIGAALGFLLGALVVIISFLADDTINTTEDIERKLKIHVLGSMPLEDSEYNGRKHFRFAALSRKMQTSWNSFDPNQLGKGGIFKKKDKKK